MLRSIAFGVGILAAARAMTLTFASIRFGVGLFVVMFAVQVVALVGAAYVLATADASRGRRAASVGFLLVGAAHLVNVVTGWRRGFDMILLGDAVFAGGMLGASAAALAASARGRAHRPAPDVAAHLAVAFCGPLVWATTNFVIGGRIPFMLASLVAMTGLALAARAFARSDGADGPPAPSVGTGT